MAFNFGGGAAAAPKAFAFGGAAAPAFGGAAPAFGGAAKPAAAALGAAPNAFGGAANPFGGAAPAGGAFAGGFGQQAQAQQQNLPLPTWLTEVDEFARAYGLSAPGDRPNPAAAAGTVAFGGAASAAAATHHHEGFQVFSKRYCEFKEVLLDFVDNHEFQTVRPAFPEGERTAQTAGSIQCAQQQEVQRELEYTRRALVSDMVAAASQGVGGDIDRATISNRLEQLRQYLLGKVGGSGGGGVGGGAPARKVGQEEWANAQGRGKFDDALRRRERIVAKDFSRGPSAAAREAIAAAPGRGARRAVLGQKPYIVSDIWPARFIAGFGYDSSATAAAAAPALGGTASRIVFGD